MAEPAAAVVASVSDQARDLADLLGQRSPGTRTQAELTKHARIAAKTRTQPKPAPHQPAADAPKTAELVDLLSPPLAPVALVAEGLAPPIAPPATLNAIVGSTPVVPTSTPPTNGGGPVHFPTSEPRDNVPPSAVPEPGTWAMMLFGFGVIGWRMRRRPASRIRLA
jgi:PEP-CTERM motif